jgi:beta-lactamase class A
MHNFFIIILSIFLINVTAVANTEKLAELEAASGGRLGISAINTANEQSIQYRAHERFPTGSTFKMMGVALVLQTSMTRSNILQERIFYKKQDLQPWSPITKKHIVDGMTVLDLAIATLQYSDSTAINLLMKKFGGPQAVNAFARSIGDDTFSLDNYEPVNTDPKKAQDSTTPFAMQNSLQKIALGDVLAKTQKEQLVTWMKNNTTGDTRIRAGVPQGWVVADKTGSGNYGVRNDIGIIWPPNCAPIVLAIYLNYDKKDAVERDDVLAQATHIIIQEFSKTDPCIMKNLN